jgi:hypothetical protein
VVQDGVVVAPGILKRIGEDRHRGEIARLVHLLRECDNGVGAPRRRAFPPELGRAFPSRTPAQASR